MNHKNKSLRNTDRQDFRRENVKEERRYEKVI